MYALEKSSLTEIKDIIVKIPVTSIKSTKGKTMDNKTYDAFKYEKHPFIVFTISKSEINTEKATIDAKGILTMAGVSTVIDLTADYKILPNGDLKITGSRKLLMADFNMEPPTAMMGTIKVGNEVVVAFEITLTRNNPIL
jgi:polyisoprenoid-binding protein YceI